MRAAQPFSEREHLINIIIAYILRQGALSHQLWCSPAGWLRFHEILDFVNMRFNQTNRNCADSVTAERIIELITYAQEPRFGLLRSEAGEIKWARAWSMPYNIYQCTQRRHGFLVVSSPSSRLPPPPSHPTPPRPTPPHALAVGHAGVELGHI